MVDEIKIKTAANIDNLINLPLEEKSNIKKLCINLNIDINNFNFLKDLTGLEYIKIKSSRPNRIAHQMFLLKQLDKLDLVKKISLKVRGNVENNRDLYSDFFHTLLDLRNLEEFSLKLNSNDQLVNIYDLLKQVGTIKLLGKISINSDVIDKNGFKALKNLKGLSKLKIKANEFYGFKKLSNASNLEHLTIKARDVNVESDEFEFKYLKNLKNLKSLRLQNLYEKGGFKEIKELKKLENLILNNVNPVNVRKVKKSKMFNFSWLFSLKLLRNLTLKLIPYYGENIDERCFQSITYCKLYHLQNIKYTNDSDLKNALRNICPENGYSVEYRHYLVKNGKHENSILL